MGTKEWRSGAPWEWDPPVDDSQPNKSVKTQTDRTPLTELDKIIGKKIEDGYVTTKWDGLTKCTYEESDKEWDLKAPQSKYELLECTHRFTGLTCSTFRGNRAARNTFILKDHCDKLTRYRFYSRYNGSYWV